MAPQGGRARARRGVRCYVSGAELHHHAESVLAQFGGWFGDTTQAPHGLGLA